MRGVTLPASARRTQGDGRGDSPTRVYSFDDVQVGSGAAEKREETCAGASTSASKSKAGPGIVDGCLTVLLSMLDTSKQHIHTLKLSLS